KYTVAPRLTAPSVQTLPPLSMDNALHGSETDSGSGKLFHRVEGLKRAPAPPAGTNPGNIVHTGCIEPAGVVLLQRLAETVYAAPGSAEIMRNGIGKRFQFFVRHSSSALCRSNSCSAFLFSVVSRVTVTNPRKRPVWSCSGVATTLPQNREPSFRTRQPSSLKRPASMAVSSSVVGFPIETSSYG